MSGETGLHELLEAMKRGAAALKDAGIPFVLAGGLAAWARGGPESEHDVDFLVKPEDAERARVPKRARGRTGAPRVDWTDVRERTKESPFGKAFFTLVEELGVVPAA